MGTFARHHRNVVTDEAWAEFYRRLLASGRERASFYCLPREDVPGFIRRVRNSHGPWWLLTHNGEMAGVQYLSDIMGKSACVHYTLLPLPMRHESGVPCPAALARYGLSSALYDVFQDGTPIMDVLIGKTPVWNRAAVKLLSRAGGTVLGEIPFSCFCHDSGRDAAGVISYFTRETVRREWRDY